MKVLLLNGPPRSGKDTIAEILKAWNPSGVFLEKFAMPMKRVCPQIYSIPLKIWREELDTPDNKDKPSKLLLGATPRKVQIDLSEKYLKPLHGPNVFGQLCLRRIRQASVGSSELVVISDSGFREEAEVLVKEFGADNVELWRISRPGCTFEGDSRSYIDLDDLGVETYEIPNMYCEEALMGLTIPLAEAFMMTPEMDREGDIEHEDLYNERRNQARIDAISSWLEKWEDQEDD